MDRPEFGSGNFHLWSLLDMLKQYAATAARLAWGFGDYEGRFTWEAVWAKYLPKGKDKILDGKAEEFIKTYLERAKLTAEQLELDAVPPQADRMLQSIKNGNYFIDLVAKDLEDIRLRIFDQLDSRLFYFVSPSVSRYYNDSALFGQEVDTAFPSAAPEIAEAGKCRALGRHSATVFHLMRVLEIGIRCLGKVFNEDTAHTNWHNILDLIDKKVRAMNSVSHGAGWKEDQQFYSESVAHFYVLKNAWRNYTMHAHERYDEERTEEIYHSVGAFMRGLAKRLSEAP
jgi:hypothetical protein